MNAVIIHAEITRRALPKGTRPTPQAHLASVFERPLTPAEAACATEAFRLSGTELAALAGPRKAPAAKQARTVVAQAKAHKPAPEKDPRKVGAQAAFAAAFAAAPEGSKRRAAGRAYREYLETHTLVSVPAAA